MAGPAKLSCHFFVIFGLIGIISCYDTEDYDIFDLVEEINQNFYEFMGVEKTATTSEIKRAYRKLAVKYHPDKNKEENAEETFRQLAAVHDVLKDEDRRQRYNTVLETGLPDWRQPVFYYRRVRKLGLLELAAILLAITTVGHFLVLWAGYFEKKFEMEEVIRSRQRKEKKVRGRQKQLAEAKEAEFEEQLQECLDAVRKPRVLDLVPFRLTVLCYHTARAVVLSPWTLKEWQAQRAEIQRMEQLAVEEEERQREEARIAQEQQKARRKNQKVVDLAEVRGEMRSSGDGMTPVVYGQDADSTTHNHTTVQKKVKPGTPWTAEETAILAKAVAKFPGGTPNRWEKIAEILGRQVKEVIAKSKTISKDYVRNVDAAAQGITGSIDSSSGMVKDHVMSKANWTDSCHGDDLDPDSAVITAGNMAVRRRKKGQRSKINGDGSAVRTSESDTSDVEKSNSQDTKHSKNLDSRDSEGEDSSMWSQNQQKILEWALKNIPKGTGDRWGKIAEQIPGKSKEECMTRYKYLAELVKNKKAQRAQTSNS